MSSRLSLNAPRVSGRRTSYEFLEVADEVGLVGVAEVEREAGEVRRAAGREPLGGLDQPITLDDPLRRYADVLAEKTLQLARRHRSIVDDLIDLRDAPV